jgi:hypothetical protein
MGCHIMDMPFRALELGFPISLRAQVDPAWAGDPARRRETFPLWLVRRSYRVGREVEGL